MNEVKCMNPWDPQSKRQYQIDGVYAALNAGQAIGGQAHGVCYCIEGNTVDRTSSKNGRGWCENVSPTLNTQDRHAIVYAIDQQGGKGNCSFAKDIMPALLSDSHGTPHAICFQQNQREEVRDMGETSGAITADSGMHNTNYVCIHKKQIACKSFGVISKGNGETILSKEKHMSLSCGGGQAGQGYPAVMYQIGEENV